VLFNEPKLLKWFVEQRREPQPQRFSALQRAEIAEMLFFVAYVYGQPEVSVLFNEPKLLKSNPFVPSPRIRKPSFSALQRAEIAEISMRRDYNAELERVSVLFNEPKLLKCFVMPKIRAGSVYGFSALQRAEIAEIGRVTLPPGYARSFQCSSTSRNC